MTTETHFTESGASPPEDPVARPSSPPRSGTAPSARDGLFARTTMVKKKLLPTDFTVENHGSIVLLTGLTEAGRTWLREHLDPAHQHFGAYSCIVEPRYVDDIITGAISDGLVVRRE